MGERGLAKIDHTKLVRGPLSICIAVRESGCVMNVECFRRTKPAPNSS